MRVISQDGTIDYPYDNSLVFVNERRIKIQLCADRDVVIIAEYSSEEKAIKTMAMLREAYNNNEFYHHTATTNTFQEAMGLLDSEKLKEVTSEYFQFPQDDEIEV